MTQQSFHPSEFAEKHAAYRSAIAASWTLGLVSLGFLSCLPMVRTFAAKSLLSGVATTAGIVAQGQRRTVRKMAGVLQDIDDISADAYQSWLYRQMAPAAGRLEATVAPEPLPLFDWAELANADEHPILGIVATMGGGKTILAKYLGRYILGTPNINVMDIYARVNDWKGCQVVTEHSEMLEFMGSDLVTIDGEISRFRQGKTDFPGNLLVCEEGADTFKALRAKGKDSAALVELWLSKYTTVTRKIRRRLCIVSVKLSGVEFGTGAESRDDCTLIFPGRAGVKKAMGDDRMLKLGAKQNREIREALTASLAGVKRPALVYHQGQWFPASIPELDSEGNPRGMGRPAIAAPPSPVVEDSLLEADPRSRLEALYRSGDSLSGDDEAEPEWKAVVQQLKRRDTERFNVLCEAILKMSRGMNEPLKARHIHQRLTALKCFSASEVRAVFLMLESFGKGVTVGDGDTLGFMAESG
jgi:hypothetical protein